MSYTTNKNQNEVVGEITIAIREVEKTLRFYGAEGQGIKELSESLKDKLPEKVFKNIRFCNHLRNRVVHDGYIPTEQECANFMNKISHIKQFFNSLSKRDISSWSDLLEYLWESWNNLNNVGKLGSGIVLIVAILYLGWWSILLVPIALYLWGKYEGL